MTPQSQFWSSFQPKNGMPLGKIGFPDAIDPRIIQAISEIRSRGFAEPILIGGAEEIRQSAKSAGIPIPSSIKIIDPNSFSSPEVETLLKSKEPIAGEQNLQNSQKASDSLTFGLALLAAGELDGLIAGSLRPTAEVVKSSFHWIKRRKGIKFVSGQFLIESNHRQTADQTPFLFSDCAVMPEPSARALAAIAESAVASYEFFTGKSAKVAFLSFSTRGSAAHPLVDRIREAVQLFKEQNPTVTVDGEIQMDAALDPAVAKIKKAEDSPITGRCNVFIFPTLESGNIGYKLLQRFAPCRIAGPILWGLEKPVSDLSRGCTVQEIVDTARCVAQLIEEKA